MRLIIATLFLLISAACNSPKSNVISKEKMIVLLQEMHIAQTAVYSEPISKRDKIKKLQTIYHSILSKYQVSKQDFHNSMIYYSANVSELDEIYKKMIESTYMQQK